MTEPDAADSRPAAVINSKLQGLRQSITSEASSFQEAEDKIEDRIRANDAVNRAWIARLILVVFAMSVGFVLWQFFAAGIQTGHWDQSMAGAADVLKTVMLPVVTLVLGYYFGQSTKPGGG